jgi:hypothetical protein
VGRFLVLVALSALAACNAVFGLSETQLAADTSIRFVQVDSAQAKTVALVDSAFASPVAPHDAIIVCVYAGNTTIANVTDTQNNTYEQVVATADGTGDSLYAFLALDVVGGPDTVTANANGSAALLQLFVHEYEFVAAFDTGTGASGTDGQADGMASGKIETSAESELLFGCGYTISASAGTNFTTRSASTMDGITEDQSSGAPGPYQATATMKLGVQWTMLVAAFEGK